MFLRKANSRWTAQAPAKLNVYLSVLGPRPDGYHEIRTLMVPIGLVDGLILEPCAAVDAPPLGISLRLVLPQARCEPVEVPSDESNLVVRALTALRQRTGCRTGARVTLTKRIPAGAGLGGGSSDAAAALMAANAAWGLGLARPALADVASSLGSDVPFFLECRPAICSGRGEAITLVERTARLHVVVVTPTQRLASGAVYAALRKEHFAGDASWEDSRCAQVLRAFGRGDVPTLGRLLYNGLTGAAHSLAPGLARLARSLAEVGGGSAVMSGSGSSYFCLCRTAREARRGAAYMKSLGYESAFATASYG
jgi:4-diphosphocytidyl-2-C-methyl-D-erythritol kinase